MPDSSKAGQTDEPIGEVNRETKNSRHFDIDTDRIQGNDPAKLSGFSGCLLDGYRIQGYKDRTRLPPWRAVGRSQASYPGLETFSTNTIPRPLLDRNPAIG